MDESQQRRLRAMVVEDSDEFRHLLRARLATQGYDVTSASSGKSALGILANHYFDLVVTDVIMPDGDGFEVINEVKRRYPTTRILVVTGGGHALGGEYCLTVATKLGAHAALMKPFSPNELIEAIRTAMLPNAASAQDSQP